MKELKSIVNKVPISHRHVISKPIVDVKRVMCIGGKGGDGALIFSKHSSHKLVGPGLPIGGDGGRGGSVYVAPISRFDERVDLKSIPGTVRASNGSIGGSNKSSGIPGNDYIIRVPLGTLIYKYDHCDYVTNWRIQCKDWKKNLIADINSLDHEQILLASGGKGGVGNNMRNPYESESGSEPEINYYEMELKSIADVGLLGLPNVGKSTLLSSITRATPKIAAYPFTTISPLIGHVKYTDGISVSVADMPGIVECNLTQEFLRHIERTKVLLYIIDVCNPLLTPFENFNILRKQIQDYNHNLSNKPFCIVMTKMDIASHKSAQITDLFYKHMKINDFNCNIIPVSAKLGLGLSNLTREIRSLLHEFNQIKYD